MIINMYWAPTVHKALTGLRFSPALGGLESGQEDRACAYTGR